MLDKFEFQALGGQRYDSSIRRIGFAPDLCKNLRFEPAVDFCGRGAIIGFAANLVDPQLMVLCTVSGVGVHRITRLPKSRRQTCQLMPGRFVSWGTSDDG